MPLNKAISHENSDRHTLRYREVNRSHPLTSPLLDDTPLPSHQAPESPMPATDWIENPDFHPEDIAAIVTISGPALDDDDPGEIYDDWGGELGGEMPRYDQDITEMLCQGEEEEDRDAAKFWGSLEDPLEYEEQEWAHQSNRLEPDDNVRLVDADHWWPWQNEQVSL